MPIKLETTSGSITLNAEDGAGAVSITLPRAGFGGSYTLPESSATVLGGVKVGSNLSIASGVLSATDTNTVYDSTAIDAAVALNTAKVTNSTSATDLTSGTLADARFPATLPAISGANLTNLDYNHNWNGHRYSDLQP